MPGVCAERIALVTGASRGIGAALARRLAAEGAAVAVTARTLDAHSHLPGSLRETVDGITRAGGRAVAIAADLADPSSRKRIVAEAEAQLGPADIRVNNAAYGTTKAALDRFSVGLAAECHADGIAVNTLSPVAAVRTPGASALGMMPEDRPELIEPMEVMVEAALALVSGDPTRLTGRVAYSGPLLAELGVTPRGLDGRPL